MMPKTRVKPLAARKSSKPYCRPLKTWVRTRSMTAEPGHNRGGDLGPRHAIGSARELAAGSGVRKLGRHGLEQHVLAAFQFAQIKVLDRVVSSRNIERPARALERG